MWIVAPVTRAVDDKVAQNLLGNSFKRQLQFDGTYSSIAVICTKADDISVTEALKVVPEEGEARQLFARAKLLETDHDELKKEVGMMKERNSDIKNEIGQCAEEIRQLRSALRRAANDHDPILFSPSISRKRASRRVASSPQKRPKPSHGNESEDADLT